MTPEENRLDRLLHITNSVQLHGSVASADTMFAFTQFELEAVVEAFGRKPTLSEWLSVGVSNVATMSPTLWTTNPEPYMERTASGSVTVYRDITGKFVFPLGTVATLKWDEPVDDQWLALAVDLHTTSEIDYHMFHAPILLMAAAWDQSVAPVALVPLRRADDERVAPVHFRISCVADQRLTFEVRPALPNHLPDADMEGQFSAIEIDLKATFFGRPLRNPYYESAPTSSNVAYRPRWTEADEAALNEILAKTKASKSPRATAAPPKATTCPTIDGECTIDSTPPCGDKSIYVSDIGDDTNDGSAPIQVGVGKGPVRTFPRALSLFINGWSSRPGAKAQIVPVGVCERVAVREEDDHFSPANIHRAMQTVYDCAE